MLEQTAADLGESRPYGELSDLKSKFTRLQMKVRNSIGQLKSRTDKCPRYPERFPVSPEKCDWGVEWANYAPPYFVDPHVIEQFDQKGTLGWADSEDLSKLGRTLSSLCGAIKIDRRGRPLNPCGRTGIAGRGELGKWGANLAADPIVTRLEPQSGLLQIVLIERGDCGEKALPGGMAEVGELPTQTLAREMCEETQARISFSDAVIVHQGFVDDRRNTDNAWIETTAAHVHLDAQLGDSLALRGGDDANSAAWYTLSPELLSSLYASHAELIRTALKRFLDERAGRLNQQVLVQVRELITRSV